MKRFVFLLVLIISNISIYAQIDEDIKIPEVFPTEDAVWVISVTETHNDPWVVFGPSYTETTYKTSYHLLGDTVIENKKYSKYSYYAKKYEEGGNK